MGCFDCKPAAPALGMLSRECRCLFTWNKSQGEVADQHCWTSQQWQPA
jgi:hypothetical protein